MAKLKIHGILLNREWNYIEKNTFFACELKGYFNDNSVIEFVNTFVVMYVWMIRNKISELHLCVYVLIFFISAII